MISIGAPLRCDNPTPSFSGWSEVSASRNFELIGQPVELFPRNSFGASIVAEDLDGDGDIDIAGMPLQGGGAVFENDGLGYFTRWDLGWPESAPGSGLWVGLTAVDLDGDGLPELIQPGMNEVRAGSNLGGMSFGAPEILLSGLTSSALNLFVTASFGDADGNGELDLLLPGFLPLGPDPNLPTGTPDLYFLRDGDDWGPPQALDNPFEESQSFCGVWTDQDRDGDVDALLTTVGASAEQRPFGLFRNGGRNGDALLLTDEAANLGLDYRASAMGITSADLNADGIPDYVISDLGRPITMLSDGDAGYYEAGAALGLTFAAQPQIIGWSVDLEDLDNDGALDLSLAGGHSGASFTAVATNDTSSPDYILEHPDTLWRGSLDENGSHTFEDVTEAVGFGDIGNHYGQAAADFDGDGFLDLVMASADGPGRLWMNSCSEKAWTEVEFVGPPGNRAGWGAVVRVDIGGHLRERELLSTRGYGQGPSRLHFGLGDAETIDELTVRWADGEESSWQNLPPLALLTVTHPSAE